MERTRPMLEINSPVEGEEVKEERLAKVIFIVFSYCINLIC
jgi:hypothetical protein